MLPYVTDDPVACQKLAALGCPAVMPLAAPIGSGLGIRNPANLRIILETVEVPVIVDAGVGTASDAAIAMELGATAVLMNTGIAARQEPGADGAGDEARGRGRAAGLRGGAHAAAALRLGVEPPRRARELLSRRQRTRPLPGDRPRRRPGGPGLAWWPLPCAPASTGCRCASATSTAPRCSPSPTEIAAAARDAREAGRRCASW